MTELSNLLKRICNSCLICLGSLCTFWISHVCGEIWEGVRLDYGHSWHVGVLSEDLNNFVNVLTLVGLETLRAGAIFTQDFSIWSEGIAISVWKVVDDEHRGLSRSFGCFKNWLNSWNLCHRVDPVGSSNMFGGSHQRCVAWVLGLCAFDLRGE